MSTKKLPDANEIIDRLKLLFSCRTDKELSDFMKLDKTTISSWRLRENVPLKYLIAFCKPEELKWVIYGQGTPDGTTVPDIITQKVIQILEGMDEEKKRDVLRYAQEKKQFQELIEHLEKTKAG